MLSGIGTSRRYAVHFASVTLPIYNDYLASEDGFQGKLAELTGKSELYIKGDVYSQPMKNAFVNLNSEDAWLYFPEVKPSQVVDSLLYNIRVKSDYAVLNENVRVSPYLNGAVVIPHVPEYEALTVYKNSRLRGDSLKLKSRNSYYIGGLGTMNNTIESFVLKKGYMATFAENEDGTGASRVYIAKDNDIVLNVMPANLANKVSMVVIRPWRWTVKKGWRGSGSGAVRFNAGSHYDYK